MVSETGPTQPRGAGGGSNLPSVFAITPSGEKIYPNEDGVLHCSMDDEVIMIGPGGAGGG
jgi:hypothetical protein